MATPWEGEVLGCRPRNPSSSRAPRGPMAFSLREKGFAPILATRRSPAYQLKLHRGARR